MFKGTTQVKCGCTHAQERTEGRDTATSTVGEGGMGAKFCVKDPVGASTMGALEARCNHRQPRGGVAQLMLFHAGKRSPSAEHIGSGRQRYKDAHTNQGSAASPTGDCGWVQAFA